MLDTKAIVLFLVLTSSSLACIGQVPAGSVACVTKCQFAIRGDTASRTESAASNTCMIQPDVGLLPGCISKGSDGKLSIAPKYRKQLRVAGHGLAPVWSESEPKGWMYVDRKGRVVVTGVAAFDNGADTFHDGLVRVARENRFGYANRAGTLVIPAIYDGAFNFENGTAVVCRECKNQCEGEHCSLIGGQWLRVDTRGRVVGEMQSRYGK
jgi:WG repeat protein